VLGQAVHVWTSRKSERSNGAGAGAGGWQNPALTQLPVPSPQSRVVARARERPSYLTSTLAPTSSNFFLIAAASSLGIPSLIGLGAPSTRSLASFRPSAVISRTTLMTLILLVPTSVRVTVKSVFSSAGAAAAPPPPAIGMPI